MEQPIAIGIDLAKNVFQVHGVGAGGQVVLRRKLRRAQVLVFFGRLPPCLIGMEGCQRLRHRFEQPLATRGRITGRASSPRSAMRCG